MKFPGWVIIVTSIILIQSFVSLSTADPTAPTIEITTKPDKPELSIQYNYTYPHLAFVKPVFTAGAYSSFYTYYSCFKAKSCSSTSAAKYLQTSPVNSWGTSAGSEKLPTELQKVGFPADKLTTINDIKVHNNELYFDNGSRKYDTLVYFHNEYVTMSEYRNTINFIKNGGNVLILNGNSFFGEVDYDPISNLVIVVDAHGFAFDGQNGTLSKDYYRFLMEKNGRENANWIGSAYCNAKKVTTGGAIFQTKNSNPHPVALDMVAEGITKMAPLYYSHEENCLVTPNAHIIADWDIPFTERYRGIKMYETYPEGPFGGSLISFGFFGNDYYSYSAHPDVVKTIKDVTLHQMGYNKHPWIRFPEDGSVLNDKKIVFDYTSGWKTRTYLNGTEINITPKTSMNLEEGTYNFTAVFQLENTTTTRTVIFSVDRTPPVPLLEYTASDGSLQQLVMKMDDKHPEFVSGSWLPSMFTNRYEIAASNGVDPVVYNLTQGVQLNDFIYTNNIIHVEAMDSAGNSAEKWFTINNGGSISPYTDLRTVQPKFKKLNTTTGYVDIPKLPENITGYLEITTNYGKNWSRVPFENFNNETDRAYYTRSSDSMWYRVLVNYNDDFLMYYREIRSYYWDDTVISTTSLNSNYSNQILHANITLELEQLQTISVSATLITTNNQSITLDLSNSVYNSPDQLGITYQFKATNAINTGLHKIRYTITSNTSVMIRETNIWIPASDLETNSIASGSTYQVDVLGLKMKGVVNLQINKTKTIFSLQALQNLQLSSDSGSGVLIGYSNNGTKIYELRVAFNSELSNPRLLVSDLGNITQSNYDTIGMYHVSSNRLWTLTVDVNGSTNPPLMFSQSGYLNISITKVSSSTTIGLRFANVGNVTIKYIKIQVLSDSTSTSSDSTTKTSMTSTTSTPSTTTTTGESTGSVSQSISQKSTSTSDNSIFKATVVVVSVLILSPVFYNKYRSKKL